MDTFYVTYDQFWEWFDRPEDDGLTSTSNNSDLQFRNKNQRSRVDSSDQSSEGNNKRIKTDNRPPRCISETEAAVCSDARYIVMWGRHRPGKKTKVWEGDGYLSLVGQMAHLCDLRGKMLEDPTVLDDIDYSTVEELGELIIGNTEVQIVEQDRKK